MCEYETEPNVPRSMSLRRQYNALQDEVILLKELNKSIRECSEAEAVNIFRQLRRGVEPLEVLRSLAKERDFVGTLDELPATPATPVDDDTLDLDESGTANGSHSRETTVHDDLPVDAAQQYRTLTVTHKILVWPVVYARLETSNILSSSDLQSILKEGTAWFLKGDLWKKPDPLLPNVSPHETLPSCVAGERSHLASKQFHALTTDEIYEISDAYFETFNTIYPLLNRATFINEIVQRLLRYGYEDGGFDCVLALLVLALGQVAIEGVSGESISVVNDKPSGFHGGSSSHPPGLGLFNEARRRLGFVSTQCNLQNVQIMHLQATYYQSTARHLDFWRSMTAASSACQVLIKCQSVDWNSTYGDSVKRAYWSCVLAEEFFHIELDLPQTQINVLEDLVPLPYGQELGGPEDGSTSQVPSLGATIVKTDCQKYYFLAMIALRRIIGRAHKEIHVHRYNSEPAKPLFSRTAEATHDSSTPPSVKATTPSTYFGPPVALVRELERQLDCWRSTLPVSLQWDDNNICLGPPLSAPSERRLSIFGIDRNTISSKYAYNHDIMTAQLRTRYYYAQFMVYRPFIYKALHLPDLMTADDCRYCVLAIKSVCEWPLLLSPLRDKKRLVPHTWAWPQHFMGILLILDLCSKNYHLRRVVEWGQVEQQKIEATVQLMLDWIHDAAQIDGIAQRSWQIVKSLFRMDPALSQPESENLKMP